MSTGDQFTVQILTQLVQVADGALLGVGLAYVAVRSLVKYASTSYALRKVQAAPYSASVSDLRSLLSSSSAASEEDQSTTPEDGGTDESVLVVVRGTVEAKSAVQGNWTYLGPIPVILSSKSSDETAVIVRRTRSCVYNEWRGFFPWTSDLKSIISRLWREESSYTRSVPFVICDSSRSDYVLVNLEGSKHPLPLVTVFHEMQPVSVSPYTLFQAFFGREYPIGLLDEEKILPVGKDVTVVGTCCSKDGSLEIKPCGDVPYFLTDFSKEQMVDELSNRVKILMWSGIIIGSVSLGILGYSMMRNWIRWREWKRARRAQEEVNLVEEQEASEEEEDSGEIPEGQLCVVCLERRSQSAFVPCGHKVCCQRCALTVERAQRPSCPVCRQSVRSSLRIYGS